MAWRIQFFLLSILSLVALKYLPGDELVMFLLCGIGVVTIMRVSSYYRLQNLANRSFEVIEVSPEEKNIYQGQYKILRRKSKEEPKSRSVGE